MVLNKKNRKIESKDKDIKFGLKQVNYEYNIFQM